MNRTPSSPAGTATRAGVLTPTGRGAVAVIQVSGPEAIAATDAYFVAANGKRLAHQRLNTIRFGHWKDRDGEEVVVCRRSDAPYEIEIHCHGGHAAAAAIMNDLRASGCVPITWQDCVGKSARDPIVADARIALAEAPTERSAAVLLDQYHGALSDAIGKLISLLDRDATREANRDLMELIARSEFGRHLTEPWRVVLAGPPNVGKSTLLNALLGYNRSIVFDEPGTTRDVVTSRTAIDGWPVELCDTAGLRASNDKLESAGVELAMDTIAKCDLLILVSDSTQSKLKSRASNDVKNRQLRVRNKIDLTPNAPPEAGTIDASALTGDGIERLLNHIAESLVPSSPPPGTAVPFTQSQRAALEQAQRALLADDGLTARTQLQAMLAPHVRP